MILPYGTRVNDCGHLSAGPPGKMGGAAGYACHADGTTVCYSCADDELRQELQTLPPRTTTYLYLSSDSRYLTSWTGGRMLKVETIWRSRISPSADGFRFQASDGFGRDFYGSTGGPNMVANIRRNITKGAAS